VIKVHGSFTGIRIGISTINAFCDVTNKIKQYPYLNKDLYCDILIVGGGVDGAVLNYYLSKHFNVALVDASLLCRCCTSAATA